MDTGQSHLCARCQQLDLTRDSFFVTLPTLPIVADSESYLPKGKPSDFRVRSPRDFETYAYLEQLRTGSGTCRLCSLLYRSIERYSGGKVNECTACSLRWEIDGRQEKRRKGMVNVTRHLRVRWHDGTVIRGEVYLVLIAPQDATRPTSDTVNRWQSETQFLGRDLDAQDGKLSLIKSWLDICFEGHRKTCYNLSHDVEFLDIVQDTFFGCIDVSDMQLKRLPVVNGLWAPYVALSYAWGESVEPHVTNKSNVMAHILHGGLESAWPRLPLTIKDAVTLTARLGLRYLWVDALCIVKDSPYSWQQNTSAMNLVYGNADFTICAADGDVSTGLRALRTTLRPFQPDSARHTYASEHKDQVALTCEYSPGVRLLAARHVEAVVNDSLWNSRAWTFQERVLSSRCLIFAEGRVYFQCRSASLSQDVFASRNGTALSLYRTRSTTTDLKELQTRPFVVYSRYMSMYTGRELTNAGDVIAAFQGVASQLSRYLGFDLQFGLPVSHFDLAMLWVPAVAVRRRETASKCDASSATCRKQGRGCTCENGKDSLGGRILPSWSWTGVIGGSTKYDSRMLEGCFMDVSDWLEHHTWIQWYIRDERGHLRPLYQLLSSPRYALAIKSWDQKWAGYPRSVEALQNHAAYQPPPRSSTFVPRYSRHQYTFKRDDYPYSGYPSVRRASPPRERGTHFQPSRGGARSRRYQQSSSESNRDEKPDSDLPERKSRHPSSFLEDAGHVAAQSLTEQNVQDLNRDSYRRGLENPPSSNLDRPKSALATLSLLWRSTTSTCLAYVYFLLVGWLTVSSKLQRATTLSSAGHARTDSERPKNARGTLYTGTEPADAGTTRIPKRLVRHTAMKELGHSFLEDEEYFTLPEPLEKGQIDLIIKKGIQYKVLDRAGPAGNIARLIEVTMNGNTASSDVSSISDGGSGLHQDRSPAQSGDGGRIESTRHDWSGRGSDKVNAERTVRYDEDPTYLEPDHDGRFVWTRDMDHHTYESHDGDSTFERPEPTVSFERTSNKEYLRTSKKRRRDHGAGSTHRVWTNTRGSNLTGNKDYVRRGSQFYTAPLRLHDRRYTVHSDEHALHGSNDWDYIGKSMSRTHKRTDKYGRMMSDRGPPEFETPHFKAILPDFPFAIIRDDPWDPSQSMVYMPVLQFFTWSTELHITLRNGDGEHLKQQQPGDGLCHCDIIDRAGDWCGHIVLNRTWIQARDSLLFRFIALSDAKAFTQEECPIWNYYIPKEREECDWDLYFVMLLERDVERGVWERRGIGKTFQAAWSEKTWDEIKLG